MGYIAPWVQMGGILMTLFHKWPCHKALEIGVASLRHTAKHTDSPASGQPVQRSYVWASQSVLNGAPQAYIQLHTVIIRQGHHCRWNTV